MSNDNKTHYRKVFKSDHLGVADLEDLIECKSNLVFTIKHVRQEFGVKVAGRKGNFNIAYFNESIKPLVLNATNSKVMKALAGGSAFVEDWGGIKVRLYIDPTASFGGEITGGVRINPNPVAARPVITKDNEKRWKNATAAYLREGNFDAVLERADISDEDMQLIKDECAANEPV